jgi:hypothetical protein
LPKANKLIINRGAQPHKKLKKIMLELSNRQINKLVTNLSEVISVLMDAAGIEPENEEPKPATAKNHEERPGFKLEIELESEPFDEAYHSAEPAPRPSVYPAYNEDEDSIRREAYMSRLCGRWTTGGDRVGIEIVRRGEHFVLYNLKRNGAPAGERYVLLWYNGEIYYYGIACRATLLALDTETDTLMVSPGVDYTRVVKSKR